MVYERFIQLLKEGHFRALVKIRPWRYLSKEQVADLTIPAGTPINTEGFAEITPPNGYMFAIRYFKLTTPTEVRGNILVTGKDEVETRLLTIDQAPGLTDQLYKSDDWVPDFFFLKKFRLYGVTEAVTTADRVLVLKWCGGLVKIV